MILWSLVVSHMGQEISGSHLSSVADLLYDLEQVLSSLWVSKYKKGHSLGLKPIKCVSFLEVAQSHPMVYSLMSKSG